MQSTTVVNVKVKYIRPKYKDLKEWVADPNNVYIGRAGIVFINGERFPKTASEFANPYKITTTVTRENCLELYKVYLLKLIESDKTLLERLKLLKGKNLGCWCKTDPNKIECHGDIMKEIIDKL